MKIRRERQLLPPAERWDLRWDRRRPPHLWADLWASCSAACRGAFPPREEAAESPSPESPEEEEAAAVRLAGAARQSTAPKAGIPSPVAGSFSSADQIRALSFSVSILHADLFWLSSPTHLESSGTVPALSPIPASSSDMSTPIVFCSKHALSI